MLFLWMGDWLDLVFRGNDATVSYQLTGNFFNAMTNILFPGSVILDPVQHGH